MPTVWPHLCAQYTDVLRLSAAPGHDWGIVHAGRHAGPALYDDHALLVSMPLRLPAR